MILGVASRAAGVCPATGPNSQRTGPRLEKYSGVELSDQRVAAAPMASGSALWPYVSYWPMVSVLDPVSRSAAAIRYMSQNTIRMAGVREPRKRTNTRSTVLFTVVSLVQLTYSDGSPE